MIINFVYIQILDTYTNTRCTVITLNNGKYLQYSLADNNRESDILPDHMNVWLPYLTLYTTPSLSLHAGVTI